MALYHFYNEAKRNHGIRANMDQTRGEANPTLIERFITDLESHGASIAHADEYRAIINYQPDTPALPDPFTTDPATVHRLVTEQSLREGDARPRMASAWQRYQVRAGKALLASMTSEADTYIEAMRPAFNTAAATIADALAVVGHDVVDAGVET